MSEPIFPYIRHDYSMINGVEHLTLRTNIRKKKGKNWYMWAVIKTLPIPASHDINDVYKFFIKEVYAIIILGKIPRKEHILPNGLALHALDKDQQSEEERMINLIKGGNT